MKNQKKVTVKNIDGSVKSAANDLLSDGKKIASDGKKLASDGKKLANALYKDGLKQMGRVEEEVLDYSDELLKKVQKNPMAAVLIAGGVGFILSTLFRK